MLTPLRQLARQAAEAGEPLAEIARRLQIPPSTLGDWAKADGFRQKDLKEKAAAEALAATQADAIRQSAEERLRAAAQETPPPGVEREIAFARARVGALLQCGLVREAEADMRAARRLNALSQFAAPVMAALGFEEDALEDAERRRTLMILMLKVCEAWEEGRALPADDGDLWHRFQPMFLHRVTVYRDVVQDFYAGRYLTGSLPGDIEAWAEAGLFRGFRTQIRDIIELARFDGQRHLATRLEAWLAEEATAQAEWAEFDADRGLRRAEG